MCTFKTLQHRYTTMQHMQQDRVFSCCFSVSLSVSSEISPEHQPLTIQQRSGESLSTESVLFYFMLDDPVRRISMLWHTAPRRPYIHTTPHTHRHTQTDPPQRRIQRQKPPHLPLSHSARRATSSDSASWVTGSQHNGVIISLMGGGN